MFVGSFAQGVEPSDVDHIMKLPTSEQTDHVVVMPAEEIILDTIRDFAALRGIVEVPELHSKDCHDLTDCNKCIKHEYAFTYACFWCAEDAAAGKDACHSKGSTVTKCNSNCISKSAASTCSSSKCPSSTESAFLSFGL